MELASAGAEPASPLKVGVGVLTLISLLFCRCHSGGAPTGGAAGIMPESSSSAGPTGPASQVGPVGAQMGGNWGLLGLL